MQSHEDMLVQVARLYYEDQLTQADIGRRLNTSRSTVSRMLKECRELGVVRIQINYPWKRVHALENGLCKRFDLRECRVLESKERPTNETMKGMGLLAADFLDDFLQDGMTLGVSYGRTIAAVIDQLSPTKHVDLTVVQILGALGSGNPLIEGPDLVRSLANIYTAQYHYLYAPLLVESNQTRDLLMQQPNISNTLKLGRNADAVILGIGAHDNDNSGLIWTGYMGKKEFAFLKSRGAVGHMAAQHYDKNGRVLDIGLNKRVLSIGLETLNQIETVIAIAGTEGKAEAISGALNGGYLDVLITDDAAAKAILSS
ncbi:MAG: sugar-binding transcriptional regulator [Chloroflexota bacterium]